MTVPAFTSLWSRHDVALGHRRRYTRGGLRGVVEAAGYRVERTLFPPVTAIRLWKRLCGDARHDLQRPGPGLNALLERLFALERHAVPSRALPFGVSLLLIARQP